MAIINYSYNNISEALNASFGSMWSECASCPSHASASFDTLTSFNSTTNPLNVDQRIKTYTSYVQSLLLDNTSNIAANGSVCIPNERGDNIEVKGRSSDFSMASIASFEGDRVPVDEEISLDQIYRKDSKVKDITDSLCVVFNAAFASSGLTEADKVKINVKKIDEDFETKINSGCTQVKPTLIPYKNVSIIEVSDIINSLIEFKLELEKIRLMNINYIFEKTELSSGMFWMFSYNGCVYNKKGEYVGGMRSKVVINYGPYTKKIGSNELNEIWSSKLKYNKSTSTQIELKNLVKIEDINSQDVNFDITNIEGINGFAEQYKSADSNDRFNIIEYDDFENTYDLKAGKVISKQKILQAIDAIFYKWINNLKTISYNVYLCHYNCHGNNFVITDTRDCCFCGECNFGLAHCK